MPASNIKTIFVAIAASMFITDGYQQGLFLDTDTLQIMANTSAYYYALELQQSLYYFSNKLTHTDLSAYTSSAVFNTEFADGRYSKFSGYNYDIYIYFFFIIMILI